MGNPNRFYKSCLQAFAYRLEDEETEDAKERWLIEKSIDTLENFINKHRYKMNLKRFYYEAGAATQDVVFDDGCGPNIKDINAMIGGFVLFENFIGLSDEEDNEFLKAWNFLDKHPIFNQRFLDGLNIRVVKVNPKTTEIYNDHSKNTKTRIWLGHTVYDKEHDCFHDVDLGCEANTFEEAIIELAKLVKKYSTDDGR